MRAFGRRNTEVKVLYTPDRGKCELYGMFIARLNPKEVAGKALARRTGIAHEVYMLHEEANISE
ncbi:MAG: hypothetical protein SWH78_00145 [Thermodesulfobacteriota bacterium]|nr:hypothetical protein [Thermodesulfobacteriota bacterium]